MIELTLDEVAQVVLARQRRRTWVPLLTLLTWLLWLGTAAWLGYFLLNYTGMVAGPQRKVIRVVVPDVSRDDSVGSNAPRVTLVDRDSPQPEARKPTPAEIGWGVAAQTEGVVRGLSWAVAHLTVILSLAVLASLSTAALLGAVRRATLRQIQASLAAIAGQLADVQRGRGTMPPTAGG